MTQRSLIDAWTNIDNAEDPTSFVRRMDQARYGRESEPSQYQTVAELLDVNEGQEILDVGCGTGGAVHVFGSRVGGAGRVVGLDISKTMIDEARRRTAGLSLPIEFRQGDAHRLPFPDNSFDRCFALRLLEIIDDPVAVLIEMYRVLRPGGRLYINAPDIDMWTFDADDREVTRKIVHHFCDKEVNGWIGRQMPRLFAESELIDIRVMPVTVAIEDYNFMSNLYLSEVTERAQASGVVSRSEAKAWLGDLQAKFRPGISPCTQTYFRIAGAKAA